MQTIHIEPFEGDNVEYYGDDNGNIFMNRLDNNKPPLHIGRLFLLRSGKNIYRTYIKKEKEHQRFRKLDAWSINHDILHFVDLIYYETEKDTYKITKDTALLAGVFRTYKGEEKLYVPINYWQKKSEI